VRPHDEFELLCEQCGYSIEGLSAGNCPECGAPVSMSLPRARAGTAWQRSAGLRAWIRTNTRMLLRPRESLRSMRIEQPRSRALRRLNITVAAAAYALLPAATAGVQLVRGEAPYVLRELTWPRAEAAVRWLLVAGTVLGLWLCAAGVLSLLTAIETWGIRSFGRVHRSRITPVVANAITAHATAGWLAGGACTAGGFAMGLALFEYAMHANVGALRGPAMLAPAWLPIFAGALGLLWFETIVYLGALHCRFANRAREREEG
jgi:hypothetical protein